MKSLVVFFLFVCVIPIVCLAEAVAMLQSTVGGITHFLKFERFSICGIPVVNPGFLKGGGGHKIMDACGHG